MFRDFFSWWIGQLSDLLPEQWRRFASSRGDAFIIDPSPADDTITITQRRRGRDTPIGDFDLDGPVVKLPVSQKLPLILRLKQTAVLAKTVRLPLAAERHVQQALSFQMEQETPFTLDEINWSHYVAARDRAGGSIAVRLLVVPRAAIAKLTEGLEQLGITPGRIEIADGPDRGHWLPFGGNGGSAEGVEGSRLLWPAAACFMLLALGVVAAPFIRQEFVLASLDGQVSAGRAATAEIDKLRRDLNRLEGGRDVVERERDNAGRPLQVLAAVTRQLPDDTYLTELMAQQRRVTLSGRSAGASRLIAALSGNEQLKNVVFTAPVTRLEALHAELFTITAEITP